MNKPTSYRDVATMAARHELNGDYAKAAIFWRTAHNLAKNGINREWSQTRAELCGRRESQNLLDSAAN